MRFALPLPALTEGPLIRRLKHLLARQAPSAGVGGEDRAALDEGAPDVDAGGHQAGARSDGRGPDNRPGLATPRGSQILASLKERVPGGLVRPRPAAADAAATGIAPPQDAAPAATGGTPAIDPRARRRVPAPPRTAHEARPPRSAEATADAAAGSYDNAAPARTAGMAAGHQHALPPGTQDDATAGIQLSVPGIPRLLTLRAPSAEAAERGRVRAHFGGLVRDGEAEALLDGLRALDLDRAATPAGHRLWSPAINGALASLREALDRRRTSSARMLLDSFEALARDYPDHPAAAALLARAHIDYGWALRGEGSADAIPDSDWEAFASHTARAQEVLAPFDPVALSSPMLAATRHLLVRGIPEGAEVIHRWHAEWAALDDGCALPHLTHAPLILPGWFGEADAFDAAARAACTRSAAPYALHYVAACATLPEMLGFADIGLLLRGFDAHAEETGCQHRLNEVACWLSDLSQPRPGDGAACAQRRGRLSDALDRIAAEDLAEIHAEVWNRPEAAIRAALSVRSPTGPQRRNGAFATRGPSRGALGP